MISLFPVRQVDAGDCTPTFPYGSGDHHATNRRFLSRPLATCFNPPPKKKEKKMFLSRRQRNFDTLIRTVLSEGRALPLRSSIIIMGVEVTNTLTFIIHLRNFAKKAA